MFEKDIYQLIRGLRAHKGNERAYIQDSLRECRKEIKSQDMDQKATALLKLVYLEMFGHDMSWASFNVLEVMSSPKYLQKRVGYLAAVQSFRPDTEVLMLAENLLKKDLNSPDKILMSLPLVAIPHVISPSMANSLLTDLLPRMSHSNPAIRKKTIVTLYRLALVYPETLRPAWPKIKEHLLDENEDPSVTAAIVNVVCELGWRRPQDFLPLAPRLFELLTAGGNNWMAIKIIKLFSVLTPLEPRLVKKLLPPLTSIIKTTPAMSLLYECINGIIQGGIMEAAGGTTEGDEIARLCVNKLRAMLVVQGDPNLRYVALLAFTKITNSHADIVSQHQDVIMECIDDGDISIRTRALDLVVGMVSAYNLQIVVERLLKQLRTADRATAAREATEDRGMHSEIVPMADDEEDAAAAKVKARQKAASQTPPLPDDYRTSVIERILEMCSRDTYTNMNDFEWYIGVLVELVKQCPSTASAGRFGSSQTTNLDQSSVANAIGAELLNVAVRVKAARPEAAAAAQSLLLFDRRERNFPAGSSGGQDVLIAAAFIAGEYANMLPDPEAVLTSLIHTSSAQLPAKALTSYLQAVPKVFAVLTGSQEASWTTTRRSTTTLFIARIINFVEPLTLHPNLDVQERAVEYLDLMRLASEAVASQQTESAGENYAEPPLLLTQAIPALFSGIELNPVAAAALRKVPQPDELDLDSPINSNLQMLLAQAEYDTDYEDSNNEVYRFYHDRAAGIPVVVQKSAAELLDDPASNRNASYQDAGDEPLTAEAIERKKAERRERYRDDPYYIDSDRGSGISTPMHNILHAANGDELDVDAIPVLELQLDPKDLAGTANPRSQAIGKPNRRQPKRHFEIAGDETLDDNDSSTPSSFKPSSLLSGPNRPKKSLLEVDSSGLSALSLTSHDDANGNAPLHPLEIERRQAEEAAMAQALKEVERLRLQMQRAQERVGGDDDDDEATTTVVKRKKPRKKKVPAADDEEGQPAGEDKEKKKKKKKKKVSSGDGEERSAAAGAAVVSERSHRDDGGPPTETAAAGEEEAAAKPATKKKKKRQVVFD